MVEQLRPTPLRDSDSTTYVSGDDLKEPIHSPLTIHLISQRANARDEGFRDKTLLDYMYCEPVLTEFLSLMEVLLLYADKLPFGAPLADWKVSKRACKLYCNSFPNLFFNVKKDLVSGYAHIIACLHEAKKYYRLADIFLVRI
jgi:hypothetical protein